MCVLNSEKVAVCGLLAPGTAGVCSIASEFRFRLLGNTLRTKQVTPLVVIYKWS